MFHFFGRDGKILHAKGHFLINRFLCTGKLVKRVLEYKTHMSAQLCHRSLAGFDPVHHDLSAVRSFIKLRDQAHDRLTQCTFSCSVFSYDTDKLTLFHGKIQAVKCQLFRMGVTIP